MTNPAAYGPLKVESESANSRQYPAGTMSSRTKYVAFPDLEKSMAFRKESPPPQRNNE